MLVVIEIVGGLRNFRWVLGRPLLGWPWLTYLVYCVIVTWRWMSAREEEPK